MKSTTNVLTSLIVLIVGILMIVWHSRVDILSWIVMAVGIMLIVPGLYSLISALVRRGSRDNDHSAPTSTIVASIGALVLGVWMVVNLEFFVGVLAFIFGGLLILFGVFHILVVGVWSRPFVLPWYFYKLPVLMIVAGIVILCSNVRTLNDAVVLITGISFVASSVCSIMEYVATRPPRLKEPTDTGV